MTTGKIITCICLILSVTLVSSCKKNKDEVAVLTPVAYVSLYQGSPDAPELSIYVDNRRLNPTSFDYADYTGYLRFYTGTRNLKFGPFNGNNTVVDTTVTFEDNKAYSIFIVDNYAKAEALIFSDESDAPPVSKAKIRFLNLSPDSPPLNLTVEGNTTPIVSNQPFKKSSAFQDINSGENALHVQSGTKNVLNLPSVTFQEGWYYTIVVRGYSDDTSIGATFRPLTAQILVN